MGGRQSASEPWLGSSAATSEATLVFCKPRPVRHTEQRRKSEVQEDLDAFEILVVAAIGIVPLIVHHLVAGPTAHGP